MDLEKIALTTQVAAVGPAYATPKSQTLSTLDR